MSYLCMGVTAFCLVGVIVTSKTPKPLPQVDMLQGSVIKFEMLGDNKFMYYKFPIFGQYLSLVFFIFFVVLGIIYKANFVNVLETSFFICGFISLLFLCGSWKIKRSRFATEFVIDKDKKEFYAYIFNIKREVKFGLEDIKEVDRDSRMFRFYLKDRKWISFAANQYDTKQAEMDNRKNFEDCIRSIGIIIKDKSAIW